MVRTTGVLNMIMMSFIAIPLVTVAWLLVGYSLAFSDDAGGGLIGDLAHFGLRGIGPDSVHGTIPELLFVTFQLTFADHHGRTDQRRDRRPGEVRRLDRLRPDLDRRSSTPLSRTGCGVRVAGCSSWARWTMPAAWWSRSSPGASALALALVLGPRIGFKQDAMRPHNLPFVLLGAGLLWFGWFGFNAGSALAANGTAAAVFLNTLVAGCLGMLGWLIVEQIRDGKPTTFGAASGVVAGLVAITPSCGTVNPLGAAVVGLAAGVVCAYASA